MAFDMVLDRNGNPAYCHTPENTKKWIKYRLEQDRNCLSGYSVRLGTTMKTVGIQGYLRNQKGDRPE